MTIVMFPPQRLKSIELISTPTNADALDEPSGTGHCRLLGRRITHFVSPAWARIGSRFWLAVAQTNVHDKISHLGIDATLYRIAKASCLSKLLEALSACRFHLPNPSWARS